MPVLPETQISLQTKVKGPKVTIEKAVLKQESKTSTSSASVSLLKASLLKKVDTKTLSIEACGQKTAMKMPPLSSLLKQPVIKPKTNNCTKPKSNIIMNSLLKQPPTVKITKKEKKIVPPLPPSISLTPAMPKIKVSDLLQVQQPTAVVRFHKEFLYARNFGF